MFVSAISSSNSISPVVGSVEVPVIGPITAFESVSVGFFLTVNFES